ncbi:hypothetical protein P692DRAFT_20822235 [Suillus brevipes Sb2]|nr:hypothetical protein P692DRAFT_20822235 [Suillus brevipes Sb2]
MSEFIQQGRTALSWQTVKRSLCMTDEEKRNRVKSANRYVDGSHILAFKGSRIYIFAYGYDSGKPGHHRQSIAQMATISIQGISLSREATTIFVFLFVFLFSKIFMTTCIGIIEEEITDGSARSASRTMMGAHAAEGLGTRISERQAGDRCKRPLQRELRENHGKRKEIRRCERDKDVKWSE